MKKYKTLMSFSFRDYGESAGLWMVGWLVWLYPAHKDEFYNKYVKGNESLFEADAAYYEKRREIEKQAIAAGVLVVHCFY